MLFAIGPDLQPLERKRIEKKATVLLPSSQGLLEQAFQELEQLHNRGELSGVAMAARCGDCTIGPLIAAWCSRRKVPYDLVISQRDPRSWASALQDLLNGKRPEESHDPYEEIGGLLAA